MTDKPAVALSPGDIVAGKYRVERVLARGGMGVIVKAHHIQLDETVALKFVLPAVLANPEAVGRFIREGRAAAKIKSEHVARVMDVGQLDGGAPYMVMEYLDGSDLEHWLRERGRLPEEQTVDFVLQACEALAEAHRLGIVHRDLKPGNLFCIRRPDGTLVVKVLDFGISKIAGSEGGARMTGHNAILGTPAYMSPEQMASSKDVDARSDIWALGVILFELLAGRLPFEQETVTELVLRVALEPAPRLSSVRPDVHPGLEQAVAACLERDRERRFQSVGELALALRSFGGARAPESVDRILGTQRSGTITSDPATGLPAVIGYAPTEVASTQREPTTAPKTVATWSSAQPAHSTLMAKIATGLALAVAVLGLLVSRGSRPTRRTGDSFETPRTYEAAIGADAAIGVAPAALPLPAFVPRPVLLPSSRGAGSPQPLPSTSGRPRPVAPSPAAANGHCTPPYSVEANGTHLFKPECL